MLNGSNCGGVPRGLAPYYVECIDHVGKRIDEDMLKSYKLRLPVDQHYIDMLIELIQLGKIRVDTKSLPDGSLLEGIYQTEKIVDSYWYFLGFKDNTMKFITISSHTKKFTNDEIVRIELKIADLIKILK
jgi:hypothetical protein